MPMRRACQITLNDADRHLVFLEHTAELVDRLTRECSQRLDGPANKTSWQIGRRD